MSEPFVPDPAPPGVPPATQSAGAHTGPPASPPPPATLTWRNVHRVTPLLNAWKIAAAIVAIALFQGLDDLLRIGLPGFTLLLIIAGAVVLGAVVGLVVSYFSWRRLSYAVSPDAVLLRSGIFFRKERVSRLARIQSVEVTQPILGRIFGFAALKVESAGGAEANITLAYLTIPEAQAVRNEILARAAGIDVDSAPIADAPVSSDGYPAAPGAVPALGEAGGADVPGAPATPSPVGQPTPAFLLPEAPEQQVYQLPAGRLFGSLLAHGAMVWLVLGVIGIVVASLVTGTWEFAFGSIVGLLAVVGFLWGRFSTEFNFRVATSPDGLRVRQGLLETKARTIPPGRIQAVQFQQGPIWRIFGWWRVQVTLANSGVSSDGTSASSDTLLPVGSADEALALLRLAFPDTPEDELPALTAGMVGRDDAEGWVPAPRRSRILDPLAYRRNAFRVLNRALVLRTGRIWRVMSVVPHERTQSLGLRQGPLERRFDLVSFYPHTSGSIGPSLPHLDPAIAAQLLADQAVRARAARRDAGPELWMRQS